MPDPDLLFAVAPSGSGAPLPARHTAFVGASRRKPPRLSGACATCRCAGSALDASPPSRVASCAARRQRRTSRPAVCGPGSGRAAGAASALGPRLDLTGSPGSLQRPHWGGARLRVRPGACRDCPPSSRQRLQPITPPFPGKEASRPLPSAVPATSSAGTAHGERRWACHHVKAKPSRAAGGRPGLGCLPRSQRVSRPRRRACSAARASQRPPSPRTCWTWGTPLQGIPSRSR